MIEVPKIIWVCDEDGEVLEYEPRHWFATSYTRSDVVEEMRNALEKISECTMSQFASTSDMADECREIAKDALKALGELRNDADDS